jgi:hypothetical protein
VDQPRRVPEIDMQAIMIQGDSVRMTWGIEEASNEPRKPIRREGPFPPPADENTQDPLRLRLSEELDYARRLLDGIGNQICADRIAVARHGVALQSLDRVGQMLGHIAAVVRSADPQSTVDAISMSDLKARLRRSGAL